MRRKAVRIVLFVLAALALSTAYKVVQINQEYSANARGILVPEPRFARPIYPYSVVRGGIYSLEELLDAVQKDPVVREHYQGVIKEAVFRETLQTDVRAYVSYRVGNQVLWSHKKVTVKAGEQVLTDGRSMIRSRCGNLLTANLLPPDLPEPPPFVPEPPEIVFETALPPLILPPARPEIPTLTAELPPSSTPVTTSPVPITPNPLNPPLVPPIWPGPHVDPAPPTPVPEPTSLLLLGSGLAALSAYVRKKH